MSKVTWRYNSLGDIELWNGELLPDDMDNSESDLYLQDHNDVVEFFNINRLDEQNVDIGDWDHVEDQGWFFDILGYFVHKDDTEYTSQTVMVVIDEHNPRLTCFCPSEGHSEMDRGYFEECIRITKAEYIRASYILHTPEMYLRGGMIVCISRV